MSLFGKYLMDNTRVKYDGGINKAEQVTEALDIVHSYLSKLDSVNYNAIGGVKGLMKLYADTEQLRDLDGGIISNLYIM